MSKNRLVEEVYKGNHTMSKKKIKNLVERTFSAIAHDLKKEGRFMFPGFGTFTVRVRRARKGRNPRTGTVITLKPSKAVSFRAAPSLKRSL